jgi:hypothetical protein
VLHALIKIGGVELMLPGSLSLKVLRMWVASALMDGERPKSRRHAQILAAVEAAARSPGLRYMYPFPEGKTPPWVELLVEISNGR